MVLDLYSVEFVVDVYIIPHYSGFYRGHHFFCYSGHVPEVARQAGPSKVFFLLS